MVRRRFGYLPDKEDSRDWDEEHLGLVAASIPEEQSLKRFDASIWDQGASNTCVAWTFAGGVANLENQVLGEHELISVPHIYYFSRRIDKPKGLLFDGGTYLRSCAKGMNKVGVPDAKWWPFSTSSLKLNRQPPIQAIMKAHPRRGGEYFRIRATGSRRIDAVQQALAAGYTVGFGTNVVESFVASDGPTIIEQPSGSERVVGGHAMLIVGYKLIQGRLLFEVRNSWGTRWRNEGYWLMSTEYLTWSFTRDLQIIRGWERLRAGTT